MKVIVRLQNVNFSFQTGSFYTILGPSGSGKNIFGSYSPFSTNWMFSGIIRTGHLKTR